MIPNTHSAMIPNTTGAWRRPAGTPPERGSDSVGNRSIFTARDRFGHFQHHYRELLVWELTGDSPTLPMIEFDGRCIRLKNAKPEYSITATDDFSFTLC
jgi:hypothetical protein